MSDQLELRPPSRSDDPESSRMRECSETRRERVLLLHRQAGVNGLVRHEMDAELTQIEGALVTEGKTSPIIGDLINSSHLFRLKRDHGKWTVHRSFRYMYNDDEVLREGPRLVTCPHCGESWPAVRPTGTSRRSESARTGATAQPSRAVSP